MDFEESNKAAIAVHAINHVVRQKNIAPNDQTIGWFGPSTHNAFPGDTIGDVRSFQS